MGRDSQGADRREALRQAWQEIREIETAYFLRELIKPAPKPVLPKRAKRPHRLRAFVLVTVVVLIVAAVWLNASQWDDGYQIPTTPALPSYCGPAAVGGDQAARALRDCPQFAKYRAEQDQERVAICMRGGKPIKPIWSGLYDSPPDPTC